MPTPRPGMEPTSKVCALTSTLQQCTNQLSHIGQGHQWLLLSFQTDAPGAGQQGARDQRVGLQAFPETCRGKASLVQVLEVNSHLLGRGGSSSGRALLEVALRPWATGAGQAWVEHLLGTVRDSNIPLPVSKRECLRGHSTNTGPCPSPVSAPGAGQMGARHHCLDILSPLLRPRLSTTSSMKLP